MRPKSTMQLSNDIYIAYSLLNPAWLHPWVRCHEHVSIEERKESHTVLPRRDDRRLAFAAAAENGRFFDEALDAFVPRVGT